MQTPRSTSRARWTTVRFALIQQHNHAHFLAALTWRDSARLRERNVTFNHVISSGMDVSRRQSDDVFLDEELLVEVVIDLGGRHGE